MESRTFIKAAGELITKIEQAQSTFGTSEQLDATRAGLQEEVNGLFSGLLNPTLPSAYRLRDTAQRAGFYVDPRVLQRLAQFENLV